MSSATSIEPAAEQLSATKPDAAREGFRPWHFFVLLSLLAATVAVILARQPAPEHLVLLSLTIGAAGLCGGTLYAALAPLVRRKNDAARPASLSERSRAVLEREKMLVLRSIKELEFDRAMGKLSASDFDEVAGRLRARAISLMKQLDAGPPAYRARIEQELAERVRSSPASAQMCGCGTANDPDAMFCKRCGKRFTSAPASSS